MKFKQALSRKLAAALSAAMILSTIAPASVPVLAAAPGDILTDSAVEQAVQETGSDEILSESVETAEVEETDADAAEDEPADAAVDEAAPDPDTAAPVEDEGTEVETPEGADPVTVSLNVVVEGGFVLSDVKWIYHEDTHIYFNSEGKGKISSVGKGSDLVLEFKDDHLPTYLFLDGVYKNDTEKISGATDAGVTLKNITGTDTYTIRYKKIKIAKVSADPLHPVADDSIVTATVDKDCEPVEIAGFYGIFRSFDEYSSDPYYYGADEAWLLDWNTYYLRIDITPGRTKTDMFVPVSAYLDVAGNKLKGYTNYEYGSYYVFFSDDDDLDLIADHVRDGGTLKLHVTQEKRGIPQKVTVSENNRKEWDGIASITDLDGEINAGFHGRFNEGVNEVESGKEARILLKLNDHYKLDAVKVDGKDLSAKELKDLVDPAKGYRTGKIEKDIKIEVATTALEAITVIDLIGAELKPVKGVYKIDQYNKKYWISYWKGGSKKTLSSPNAVSKAKNAPVPETCKIDSDDIEFNGSTVPGDQITITFRADGVADEQKVVFDVAKAGSLKISKTSDTMPVGGTRSYKVTPRNVRWTVSGDILDEATKTKVYRYEHFDLDWELINGQKELKLTSCRLNKDEIGKTYDIFIVDENDPASVLATLKITFGVDEITGSGVKAPGLKIKSTDLNSMYLDLSTKVDASIRGLYYAVTVKDSKKDAKRNPKFVDEITRYYKVTGKSQTVYFSLLNPEDDTFANEREQDLTRQYGIEVKLIQYDSYEDEFNNLTDYKPAYNETQNGPKYDANYLVAEGVNKTTAKKEQTLAADTYATKLKLNKVKGQSGKAYTDMCFYDEVSAGTESYAYKLSVDYGKNTTVKKLRRVELLDKSGKKIDWVSLNAGYRSNNDSYIAQEFSRYMYVTDDTISFYPGGSDDKFLSNSFNDNHLPVGTYTIVAYAFEPLGTEVTAKAKVRVVQGIEKFTLQTDAAGYTYYKQPGKAFKMSVKAIDLTGKYGQKGKTIGNKNMKWEITAASPDLDYDGTRHTGTPITIKNGKVTIKDKKFVPAANTWFRIRATAADWKGTPDKGEQDHNKYYNTRTIDITIRNNTGKSVSIYNEKNDERIVDNSTYTVEEFFRNYDYNWNPRYYTFLEFKDDFGYVSMKYKVSGAAKLDKNGRLVFKKFGKMTITGKALDGSGRKLDKTVVEIVPAKGDIKYNLIGYRINGDHGIVSSNYKDTVCDGINYGTSLQQMVLDVKGIVSGNKTAYMNVSVTVRGGKVKTYKGKDGAFWITPGKDKTEITIKSKKGGKSVTFTVTNAAIVSNKVKIKAGNVFKPNGKDGKGKVYSYLNYKNDYTYDGSQAFTTYDKVSANVVNYTLDGALTSTNAVVVTYKWDKKRASSCEQIGKALNRARIYSGSFGYVIPVVDNKFTIDYSTTDRGTWDVAPGTYKLTIAPIAWDKDNHKILSATGKPAALKVKFAKAPRAKVKIGTKFDFGAGCASGNKVSVNIVPNAGNKNFIGDAKNIRFDVGYDNEADKLYKVNCRGVNKKGSINHFGKNFSVTGKPGEQQLEYGSGVDHATMGCAVEANNKKELQGYIPVTFQQYDGTLITNFVKVKIKLKKGAALGK